MGSLRRISRNFFAGFVANINTVLNQWLLPPVFLHRYGVALYGEWLALSVGVAYLRTLNFGIQTYVNQDLTVRFHRGEIEGYHLRQSTALRLLLGICTLAAMGCLTVFLLQPSHLLRLSISDHEASLALYFLALQVLVNILFGYISGIFMVMDMASRGAQWNNFQRILLILATLAAAWMRVSFSTLALVQLATYIVAFAAVLIDLKLTAPQIFPSLRYWDSGSVPEILKGGGHFGLIFSCTFLSYEAPMLLLQRILGPASVVAFYLMRTIFSTPRQLLAMLTQSMGPEITSLFAKCDWKGLRALYGYSEQFIFACIPTINLAVLVASPWLLAVWHVRSGGVFMLHPYVLCAAISIVLATEEHKYQFQFSTNTHEKLARFLVGSYLLMIAASVPMIHHFQLMGFLYAWFATESIQLAYIVYLNHELFDPTATREAPLSLRNLVRMLSLSIAGLLIAAAVLKRTSGAGHLLQIASALITMIVTGGITYVLFDLKHVQRNFTNRIRNRFAPQNV